MNIFNDAVDALTNHFSSLWPQPDEKPQLVNGKLRACPGTPNCVNSESTNPMRNIAPLAFSDSSEQAWAALKLVVREQEEQCMMKATTTFGRPLPFLSLALSMTLSSA